MSVRVKICGITNLEDARMAVEAGADALGFVFCIASPRCLSYSNACQIIRQMPPMVMKIGVFVNPPAEVARLAIECGLDAIQFHGDEPPDFCQNFVPRAIKAFRVRDAASLERCEDYRGLPWLLDSYVAGQAGGTGEKFNWDLAAGLRDINPFLILAGGLTPDNVGDAVRRVRPWAVDVSSGVESAPGKKDPDKVRRFLRAAKQAA